MQSSGVAGAGVLLTATAVDGSNNPATSVAVISLSSASATGAFSQDSGYSWASVTTVALSAGSAALEYRDTKNGPSQALAGSALGAAAATITLTAGAPYLISGTASPSAVFNNSANGPNTSTLTAFVLDAYLNPVSGTTVTWTVAAGGGSLSTASSVSNALGQAQTLLTVGSSASASNYVRATVAGIKPTMINVSATKATRLNISPSPATGGVGVATSFIVLAQDNNSPAITGYSAASVEISSTAGTLSFSPDASTFGAAPWTFSLSSGQGLFYAKDSQATGASGRHHHRHRPGRGPQPGQRPAGHLPGGHQGLPGGGPRQQRVPGRERRSA